MKIRTITTGISLDSPKETAKIKMAANFNQKAQMIFAEQGYEVQTTRISTNTWEEYLAGLSLATIIKEVQVLEELCQSMDVSFFNIGYASSPETIEIIPELNKTTSVIYCSSKIRSHLKNVKKSAQAIKRISQESDHGLGNFRFCAWANCPPNIPFFPTSYHTGATSFTIGLELGELVMQVFSQAQDLEDAESKLQNILTLEVGKVVAIAEKIASQFEIKFHGVDTSLTPSLNQENSIAFAYEKLLHSKFGNPGTLAISAMLTRVLKSLSTKNCGYCGLMLPVCEDIGLATRANEQTYDITNLLLYSAVCGCGLDTVPIPGDITVEKIAAILSDMATLAFKLDKPLSARLFPIPHKKAGEMTSFNSPYLVDCQIFSVS